MNPSDDEICAALGPVVAERMAVGQKPVKFHAETWLRWVARSTPARSDDLPLGGFQGATCPT